MNDVPVEALPRSVKIETLNLRVFAHTSLGTLLEHPPGGWPAWGTPLQPKNIQNPAKRRTTAFQGPPRPLGPPRPPKGFPRPPDARLPIRSDCPTRQPHRKPEQLRTNSGVSRTNSGPNRKHSTVSPSRLRAAADVPRRNILTESQE